MDRDAERELDVIMSEEKAKIVLGVGYANLPYEEWVEELKCFVLTQRCADCGSPYDLDDPEEQIWGWFGAGDNGESAVEELEVVEFICKACETENGFSTSEASHPRTLGTLVFRRNPTGTFPLDVTDDESAEDTDD